MGKRSNFERVEKDFYRSIDIRIGEALKPHLAPYDTYAEPCCGYGDLIKQLDMITDASCVYANDIQFNDGKDALKLKESDIAGANLIITNPPWTRSILHGMITTFSNLRPTWLLFDADWMHTKQSAVYMDELCTDIISVGRVVWIEGTKTSGKDNVAWYRFDKDKSYYTRFYGRVPPVDPTIDQYGMKIEPDYVKRGRDVILEN